VFAAIGTTRITRKVANAELVRELGLERPTKVEKLFCVC